MKYNSLDLWVFNALGICAITGVCYCVSHLLNIGDWEPVTAVIVAACVVWTRKVRQFVEVYNANIVD